MWRFGRMGNVRIQPHGDTIITGHNLSLCAEFGKAGVGIIMITKHQRLGEKGVERSVVQIL
jgi:hypothetical protein